jgi:hypothetical protein
MLKFIKSKNPDKEYPSNLGQKWTYEEDSLLLDELSKNMDIELIAQLHNRTIGGINARCRGIAYDLYCNDNSIEEIVIKTRLDEDKIIETINMRNNSKKGKSIEQKKEKFSIETEIVGLKNDMKELKNTLKELVEMIKAVYEFEDV